MAAACWMYAWRPLWQITSGPGRLKAAVRYVSSSVQKIKTANSQSPWVLHGAVCLQRLPVISQDLSPVEEKFMELMRQVILEKTKKHSDSMSSLTLFIMWQLFTFLSVSPCLFRHILYCIKREVCYF